MKLNDVDTVDVRGAIELGCRTMENVFDADDNHVPFFRVVASPTAKLEFNPLYSEAHVPGRHLNALLNAEDVAGIDLDEEAVNKHARAMFLSYSSSLALPMNRAEKCGLPVNFDPHNIREGFHALYALAKYRDCDQARSIADASIATILNYWSAENGWDFDELESAHGIKCRRPDPSLNPLFKEGFIRGIARAIGPLVKYYRATAHKPSLELANVLKDKVIDEYFLLEGRYDGQRFGHHTHSTTCVMSSLAQLADALSDSKLIDRVKTFYDNGLWDIRDDIGWVIENSKPSADPDRGEVNNSGDILETALILGRWGYTECFDDAELILRAHILPSQLRDVSFIQPPPNPENVDGMRDVAQRLRGAFGFPAPYGHDPLGTPEVNFNTDIVGGTVGSLCEALRESITTDEAGCRVNLLFDHQGSDVVVESPYTHPSLRVMAKKHGSLHVRIPNWVNLDDVTVDGLRSDIQYSNGYIVLPNPQVGQWIQFSFPMAKREFSLRHRTRNIRVQLRGDEVVQMDNFGSTLNFFNNFE